MSTELVQFGDRAAVRELGDRLRRFLPGGRRMGERDALELAQIALAQDLNPFAREIWFIPGIGAVTGIEGYRKAARRQSSYSAKARLMTGQERQEHGLDDKDIGVICEIYRHDLTQQAVEINNLAEREVIPVRPVEGVGIWRPGDNIPKTKTPLWVAQKRAEVDGLRKAFDLPLGLAEGQDPDDWRPVEISEPFDEVTGELLGPEELEQRPAAEPETVRRWLRIRAKWSKGEADDWSDARRQADDKAEPPHDREVQRLAALMGKALKAENGHAGEVDRQRYAVLAYLFNRDSTKLLTAAEVRAAISWLGIQEGSWEADAVATEECGRILQAALEEAGQGDAEAVKDDATE